MFEYTLPVNELVSRRLRYLLQTRYNGSYATMFERLYDEVADEGRLKLFKAYIDRGNMNEMFFSRLAQKTKIGEVSFNRFFDLYVDNADLFGD